MEDFYKGCSFYELINYLKDQIFGLMFYQNQGESGDALDALCRIRMILDDATDLYDKKDFEINDLEREVKSLEKKLMEARGIN